MDSVRALGLDLGLLVLRLAFGGIMLVAHGWGKLEKVVSGLTGNAEGKKFMEEFPDPLGIGNALSAISAAGTETICAAAVVLGVATRLNSIALAFTMVVAAFMVHANDPFRVKELAILFLVGYVALILTGPGRFSLDHILRSKLKV
jgi:putative oxidoreductase